MKTTLKRTLSILAPSALATAVLTSPVLADVSGINGYGGFGGHMGGWGGGWGHGFAGGFMMVGFWVVLIGAVVLGARWLSERNSTTIGTTAKPDGLAILQDRLARGEIDPEEYASRRKALES